MTIEKTAAFGGQHPENTPQLAPEQNLIGRILAGAYQVTEILGAGGMGVVYRATQLALDRPVALKTILPGYQVTELAIERFHREAKVLSQLNHPNIVQVIDFGIVQPGPIHYLVMELLEGEALDHHVQRLGGLSLEAILGILNQLCSGLEAAHDKQVTHRDLKPANVFLAATTGSGQPLVKVLDFGLAKMKEKDGAQAKALTQAGLLIGTLGYTAPEQLQSDPSADHRADVYSLGAILYFMVSGRDPYSGSTLNSILVKQLSQPPDPIGPLNLPQLPAVERVIHKAMNLDPSQRHGTPGEFIADLERAIRPNDTQTDRRAPSALGVRSATPSTAAIAAARKTNRPWWWAGGLVALAGGVLLFLLLTSKNNQEPGQPKLTATAPGVTESEIMIGMSGPFSGPARELGRSMQIGIKTYFNEINDAGGVHGRKLKLLALDDKYDPEKTKDNTQKLLAQPVFAFLGNVGTATTAAALPLIQEKKRVLFGAFTGGNLLRQDPPDRYVFNVRASYAQETAAMVHYLIEVKRLRPEQIAVFAQNDSYGDDGFAGVAKALRKHGFDSAKTLRVSYDRQAVDVQDAVKKIAAARDTIKAVVMVGTYVPAARFIKALKDQKADLLFFNVSFVGSNSLAEELREAGPGYTTGVMVTQVVPHPRGNASGVLRFRDSLQKYYPTEQSGFVSLEGYLAAQVFVEGLKKAGPNLTPETLVNALETLRDLDLAFGSLITYGPSDHHGGGKVWGTVMDEKGHYQVLDLE